MILHHLAIVAKVVHDHSEKYHLFKRQCFWYSDVVSGVLEKHFSLSKVKVSDTSLTADHATDAEMEIFDSLRGTCNRVKIYQRRMDLIDEIHALFVARKKDIESSVNLLNICIFLLTNHDPRSWNPERLLRQNIKVRRGQRKRSRECRKRMRRNGRRRREC